MSVFYSSTGTLIQFLWEPDEFTWNQLDLSAYKPIRLAPQKGQMAVLLKQEGLDITEVYSVRFWQVRKYVSETVLNIMGLHRRAGPVQILIA